MEVIIFTDEWELQIWSSSLSVQPEIAPLVTNILFQYIYKKNNFFQNDFPRSAKKSCTATQILPSAGVELGH